MNNTIKVIAIVGLGRSGSTLLERILGQLEHFISCGELHQIWHGIETPYNAMKKALLGGV